MPARGSWSRRSAQDPTVGHPRVGLVREAHAPRDAHRRWRGEPGHVAADDARARGRSGQAAVRVRYDPRDGGRMGEGKK